MTAGLEVLEKRQDKIDNAIEKLTELAININKIIAVQEQRLTQQEKNMSYFEEVLEKRREESEIKLKDVYETIRSEDKHIINEINQFRLEAQEQHEKITEKINKMEKMLWMYIGGFTVIVFLINYLPNLTKLIR